MIKVTRVSKSFGRVVALDAVSLAIGEGERVAFVGANGSGKTTLLRALLGLVRFEGTITVAGDDVARAPEIALRSVAYVPQIAPPLEAPVAEVVRACASLRGGTEGEIYERAGRLGLDVGACRGKRFRDLSGGTKQKLLAAMALAAATPVLVCDEPTANLDGEARASFFEQLAERPTSSVIVLCSHRVDEVRWTVSRVVEMVDGRVASDGPPADLYPDAPTFRVEVTLREGTGDADSALRASGFARSGSGRLVAVAVRERAVALATRLMKDHGAALTDLTIAPIGAVPASERRPRPGAAS
ncbi:MAG: ABC transporter ATP-binding protein [Polyangiaceae bacterium]|jgi:ABC-type multidrug transport system ATPase subunit|nr:ABC transporter ATP-binding protein [Polyangiaceae bacterium]